MIGRRTLSAAAGLFLLASGGCLYPYGMHPGMYGQPIPPQGAAVLPQGAQVTYLDSAPVTADPSVNSPAHSNSQPGFTRGTVTAPDTQGSSMEAEGPVPEPRDPAPSADGGAASAVRTSEGVLDTGNDLTLVRPDEPVFLKPVVMNEEDNGQSVVPAHGTTPLVATQPASDLGRDPNYRWLQGDLQYDVQNQSWHLIYDYNPDDTLGGEVTLSGNLPFTPADNDRVYRVTGTFDRNQLDRVGKPVYRVTGAQRMSR